MFKMLFSWDWEKQRSCMPGLPAVHQIYLFDYTFDCSLNSIEIIHVWSPRSHIYSRKGEVPKYVIILRQHVTEEEADPSDWNRIGLNPLFPRPSRHVAALLDWLTNTQLTALCWRTCSVDLPKAQRATQGINSCVSFLCKFYYVRTCWCVCVLLHVPFPMLLSPLWLTLLSGQ